MQVMRSQKARGPKGIAALHPRRRVPHLQGLGADEIKRVVDLCHGPLKCRPSLAGIVQKSGHALRVVLNDQLIRVATGELDAVGVDGVDVLGEKGLPYAE